jgi:dCTP deaminase
MILSNVEIHKAITEGDLIIDPEPRRFPTIEDPDCPYGTSAVNLRLGPRLSIAKHRQPMALDLRKGGIASLLAKIYTEQVISADGGFALEPHSFVLGQTIERIVLPMKEGRPVIAARVEGRSSFARCGLLVHFTAPTVHAGFEGTITLEIINLGLQPIMLYPNMEICQLVFERVDGMPRAAPSQFHGQTTPAGTK